jgi:hypothetical protein
LKLTFAVTPVLAIDVHVKVGVCGTVNINGRRVLSLEVKVPEIDLKVNLYTVISDNPGTTTDVAVVEANVIVCVVVLSMAVALLYRSSVYPKVLVLAAFTKFTVALDDVPLTKAKVVGGNTILNVK